MNKKADIPTVLIFLIAIALSTITLFILLNFRTNLTSQSSEISQIAYETDFAQQYLTESAKLLAKEAILSQKSDIKKEFQNLAAQKEFIPEGAENFFGKIARGEFTFTSEQSQFSLEIRDISLTSSQNTNSLTRTFDITQKFDKTGNFIG